MNYHTPGTTQDYKNKSTAIMEKPMSLSGIKEYTSAEMSLHLEGPVPPGELSIRKAVCLSCEYLHIDKEKDKIGFCKACGCGTKKRAALTVKLTMPKATCPKDKWQPTKGRHKSIFKRIAAYVLNWKSN